MDIRAIERNLQNCSCGREHKITLKAVEIGSGLVHKAGEILDKNGFPKKLLLVSDQNAMRVSKGITDSLKKAGFSFEEIVYEDMRFAKMETVEEIEKASQPFGGILSVGTGSVNDICRLASYNQKKEFAIFATAPSMDGFASDTSPIIKNNFKKSYQAAAPAIIIADTKILAESPVELKAAGLGDLLAKYIGIVDWKVAKLTINEYYCDAIADMTIKAVDRAVALGDKVIDHDEETAGAIMEALVFTGMAMQLAGSSRPASGAEHVVSHFWEINKVKDGIWPDFHGKKVGVATCLVADIYHKLAKIETIDPVMEKTDWAELRRVYDVFVDDMEKANNPQIMDKVDVSNLKAVWPEIRKIIQNELPTAEKLVDILKKANAATTAAEVHVNEDMKYKGLRYSPYMRYRITLLRLLPTLNVKAKLY